MKRSFSLVLFLLAVACTSVQPPAEPVHVVLVGTTDVHGWFNGHVETRPGGGEGVIVGGLPILASYFDALRAKHGANVIAVDAGDMFQGTLESNMSEGEAVVRGYNAIGYAAAAVGNHEFDFGPVGPEAIAHEPGSNPLGALERNAALAKFPFLSANMIEKATGRVPRWAKPYTMVRAGRANIGIIGLSTPDTPNVTMAVNVESLAFTDPVEATVKAARELRAQGADAIVVVAHMGGRCRELHDPRDLESCDHSAEAFEYLEALPAGTVDAFFAGHTHAQMRHYVNGVAAAQALPLSRQFATIDLWIDPRASRVVRSEIRPHTMVCAAVFSGTESCDPAAAEPGAALVPREFAGRTIAPDVRVAAVLEPYLRRVAAKRDEKVGIATTAPFTRSYFSESSLGNLLADALREATGADIAFMNSGGIRAELPKGPLTYGDIFAVSPFDNYPAFVFMTGAQVAEMLRATTTGARGILQVSGLRYTIDASKDADKPPAERDRLVSVTLEDGSPLDPEKLYTVVMPDFIAAGGDGVQEVMGTVERERVEVYYARPIRDVFLDVLKKSRQPLEPRIEGRITVRNAG